MPANLLISLAHGGTAHIARTFQNSIFAIKRLIKSENIEIVHVHNTLNLISPAVYYAARTMKVPVVQTVHNFRLLCPGATFYRDGHICEDCMKNGLWSAVAIVASLASKVGSASGLFGKLGAALGGISAPVMAVVAVIGTLVAAFMTLWNTNEEFRTAITAIWEGIKTTFATFAQEITTKLNSLGFDFKSITDVLKVVWNGFCAVLAPVFEGAFQLISSILSVVLNTLSGLLSVFVGVFTGDWQSAWDGVKQIFSGVWEFIKNTFSTVLNTLKGGGGCVPRPVRNGLEYCLDLRQDILRGHMEWHFFLLLRRTHRYPDHGYYGMECHLRFL